MEEGWACQPRPLINKSTPLNRDYNRDHNIKSPKRSGSVNHGSTLCFSQTFFFGDALHNRSGFYIRLFLRLAALSLHGDFPKSGAPFSNEDYSIWGVCIGLPLFGEIITWHHRKLHLTFCRGHDWDQGSSISVRSIPPIVVIAP